MFERISSKNLKFMRSIFSLQYLFIFILLSGYYTVSTGQSESDSIKIQTLSPVTIQSWRVATDVARLNAVIGTYLVEGKKNEVISLDQMSANVTEKTARQIFAKVPGIFVYDMDGAGNQINIATRGLDPHRGWEFNIRKDGVITNSDMYAYPANGKHRSH
jgi:Fe(3+) dicitrate transport protein